MFQDFPKAEARQPSRITRLVVILEWRAFDDRDRIQPVEADTQDITYRATFSDDLGRPVMADRQSGDLSPYLMDDERTALLDVLAAVHARAQKLVAANVKGNAP